MNTFQRPLGAGVLDQPVVGRNLTGGTLRTNLREPTLLVFLRHLG